MRANRGALLFRQSVRLIQDGKRDEGLADVVQQRRAGEPALVENRSYRVPYTRLKAFTIMEEMGDKVDQQLLQAFRPVAVGIG